MDKLWSETNDVDECDPAQFNLMEDIQCLKEEVERLKGMEPLLKMFLKDGYNSPTGRISKKTGLAMVRYVAANGINSFDL